MLRFSKRALRTALALALALCAAAPMAQASGGATVIPVDTTWKGVNYAKTLDCTSNPGTCELYYGSEITYSGGSWSGSAHVDGQLNVATDQFTETWSFTGTMGGCGSGTIKFTYQGVQSGTPNPDGGFPA